ncbi:Rrf2 family transcriptional regulator [Streptomyces parvulus]|uniref:Rrf2 family transcriptional regulator n=1 Tax=Streptomyces parvulus TaxID=146923 RepID=A0A369UW73_9ACTN|nr:Rrf2 family transcriptional regulator [Streptomyces parvulus]RDD83988.1 Rrf2 family transcriptional regulator [Streptomyces parvulus]
MARSTNTQFAVAVHVLTYLAGTTGHPVSSDKLSASTQVNPVHVRRVLGPLRNAGLVASHPGAHGGWLLARGARDITLAEIWRILQGGDPVLAMHDPDPACATARTVQSALTALDGIIADAITARLESVTVHDVVAGRTEHPRPPGATNSPILPAATTPSS